MLTPVEIQSKTFKKGFGFDTKDVEGFMKDILKDYEVLYKENIELNEKIGVLSEGVQYYKSIEKTLQKALVLAQKAAQETETAAKEKAENIVNGAIKKAAMIEEDAQQTASKIKMTASEQANTLLSKAREELSQIQADVANLLQQYDKYKIQYKQLINTQLEILDSPAYNIDYSQFVTYHSFISSQLAMPELEEEVVEEPCEKEEQVENMEVQPEEEPVVEVTPSEEEEEPVSEEGEEKKVAIEEEYFIPTIDLSGILDNAKDKEVEKEEPVVSDHGMKEIHSQEKSSDLDRTLNEMSEKELLLKLFSNVGEPKMKASSTEAKSDFEFLDL